MLLCAYANEISPRDFVYFTFVDVLNFFLTTFNFFTITYFSLRVPFLAFHNDIYLLFFIIVPFLTFYNNISCVECVNYNFL